MNPEAEYRAAKAAYIAALKRLKAAKAAAGGVEKRDTEARREARKRERLDRSAKAMEAWLSGASKRAACKAVGLYGDSFAFEGLRHDLIWGVLSHAEQHDPPWEDSEPSWTKEDFDKRDRAIIAKALARYRESMAP